MNNFFSKFPEFSKYEFGILHKLTTFIQSTLANRKMTAKELSNMLIHISPDTVGLSQDDFEKFDYFRSSIIEMLNDENAVNYLTDALHDYHARYLASVFLGWFGSKASTALPILIDLASAANSATGAAYNSIILIGEAEEKILGAVEKSLEERDDFSFLQLGSLALKTKLYSSQLFLDILGNATANSVPDIRENAISILVRMDPMFRESILVLLKKLQNDESQDVKEAAIESMTRLAQDGD